MRRSREPILEEISMENTRIHENPLNSEEFLIRKCFMSAIVHEYLRHPFKFHDFNGFHWNSNRKVHLDSAHILQVEFLAVYYAVK